MERHFTTRVYVLGDDIDTDQIIPARYLAISLSDPAERARYGGLAMSGVPADDAGLPYGNLRFSDPDSNRSEYGVIVAGRNFGCGSSREHAPVALAEAGILAVIATSYARIFYRNAIDGGYFPPIESEQDLSREFRTGDEVQVDLDAGMIRARSSDREFKLRELGAAGDILSAGGLFAYARQHGFSEEAKP